MKHTFIQKHIDTIETIEGCSASEILFKLYIVEFYTYRKLQKRWNIGNNRAITNLLNYFNIPIRYGSDAIKSQWVNNDERKKKTSEKFKESLKGIPHPNFGKTKETSKGLKSVSDKLKITSSFFNPLTITKATITRKRNFAKDISTHINKTTKPTKCESIVIEYLESIGYKTIHNYNEKPYWIDVFIPELNVAIECFGANRLPFDYNRHYYITSKNIAIIYISNYQILRGGFSVINNYIERINELRLNPTFNSKDSVVIGAKNRIFCNNNIDKITIETINVDKINTSFITASSKHDVINL